MRQIENCQKLDNNFKAIKNALIITDNFLMKSRMKVLHFLFIVLNVFIIVACGSSSGSSSSSGGGGGGGGPDNPPLAKTFSITGESTVIWDTVLSPISVSVLNSAGTLDTTFTGDISVTIGTDPSGLSATLTGTTIVAAVGGVANFSNLKISEPASGYSLTFSASGVTSFTKTGFNVGSEVFAYASRASAQIIKLTDRMVVPLSYFGFQIYDPTQVATPKIIGTYRLNSIFSSAEKINDNVIAYGVTDVAGTSFKLVLMDFTSAVIPSLKSQVNLTANPTGLCKTSSLLFVVTTNGIEAFNYSNLSSLASVFSETRSGAISCTVSGTKLFVASDTAGLFVYEIGASSLSLLGSYNSAGNARSVIVEGNRAYLADYGPGFHILDITDLAAISLINTYNTTNNADFLYKTGTNIIVADRNSGVRVFDISDENSITPLSPYYNTNGVAIRLEMDGTNLWVSDNTGFVVLNAADLTSLSLHFARNYFSSINGFAAKDNYLMFGSATEIWNVSNPKLPAIASTTGGVSVNEQIVVGTTSINRLPSSVVFYNVSDPTNVSMLPGGIGYSDSSNTIAASNGIALAVGTDDGSNYYLSSYTIADGVDPVFGSQLNLTANVSKLAISGTKAFGVDNAGSVFVYNIANLASMSLLGSTASVFTSGPSSFAVKGNVGYALVINKLIAIDLTTAGTITTLDEYSFTNSTFQMLIDGNNLFVIESSTGIHAIDIETPSDLKLKGSYADTNISNYKPAKVGNYLYYTSSYGVGVINVSNPSSLRINK